MTLISEKMAAKISGFLLKEVRSDLNDVQFEQKKQTDLLVKIVSLLEKNGKRPEDIEAVLKERCEL